MRARRFAILVAVAGALTACGSSKSTTASTSGASTTSATASATTATPSATPTNPAGGQLTDACTLLTPAEVTAVTKVTLVNPAPGTAATCTYDSAESGLFFSLAVRELPTGDQASFDTMVTGQEAAPTITAINGIGDGHGALAKHDVNYTAYGFVGKTALAVTVFNGAADPAANAQELLKVALSRL